MFLSKFATALGSKHHCDELRHMTPAFAVSFILGFGSNTSFAPDSAAIAPPLAARSNVFNASSGPSPAASRAGNSVSTETLVIGVAGGYDPPVVGGEGASGGSLPHRIARYHRRRRQSSFPCHQISNALESGK